MAIKSVRELARSLGLSHTTVSDALRNNPRVKEETRQRVLQAADEAGYQYNPLAGALMSEMRRSGVGTFRGVVAIVDLEDAHQRPSTAQIYHRQVVRGATTAAHNLGFKTEIFVLGRDHLSIERLSTILKSRGIRGVFLLPAGNSPDIQNLDWDHFAGIYSDYIIERPGLNSVCSDHFRSMVIALRRLDELGYRRPGVVLHDMHDRRLLYRWEAAFRTFHEHNDCFDNIPPLIVGDLNQEAFTQWFLRERPDVVMAHNSAIIEWMEAAGARVPHTHGYCSLNVWTSSVEVAGLDLRPQMIGMRAMEQLIAQLHRNEYGVPETPSTTTIPAGWKQGPTLVAQVDERICAAV
ncbi:MAG: LacI family DNA-binding transcriptional regulator [Verrucomicrobiota bacterium JB022]|nr:LacI family DNA-binding transcriptional regulator [Verrucomicrobiota bacterium JB022]